MCIRDRSTGRETAQHIVMVKRSMKGKPKADRVDSYDVEQLERKRRKKEGTEQARGPSVRPDFKRKRRHRTRTEAREQGERTTFPEAGEADAADEVTGREAEILKIKKKLAEDAAGDVPRNPSVRAPKAVQGVSEDKLAWKALLTEYLADEAVAEGELKDNLNRLLKYDNVPVNRKPSKFKNFVKESLALFDKTEMIEQMWQVFDAVTKPLR
eukprot:TRINITY_DN23316_c0_g1_i1.p2 TRINITY_DN23316_c0_g1~~TRINITY_DN23316_c0_g1_i1.p2  ORF type:complete len:212 (-),score=70.06 TRINITY_DN23316_c0_g1_i1:57-692(-)